MKYQKQEIKKGITLHNIETDKITVISISELFAEAIRRIHNATSIGELFE